MGSLKDFKLGPKCYKPWQGLQIGAEHKKHTQNKKLLTVFDANIALKDGIGPDNRRKIQACTLFSHLLY